MKQITTFLMAAAMTTATTASAQNPIVQTWFTSDPAPMVTGGRMYVYTGHDEDGADFFWMNEWRVYSTDDMVNWTDHGSPLNLSTFSYRSLPRCHRQTPIRERQLGSYRPDGDD